MLFTLLTQKNLTFSMLSFFENRDCRFVMNSVFSFCRKFAFRITILRILPRYVKYLICQSYMHILNRTTGGGVSQLVFEKSANRLTLGLKKRGLCVRYRDATSYPELSHRGARRLLRAAQGTRPGYTPDGMWGHCRTRTHTHTLQLQAI